METGSIILTFDLSRFDPLRTWK